MNEFRDVMMDRWVNFDQTPLLHHAYNLDPNDPEFAIVHIVVDFFQNSIMDISEELSYGRLEQFYHYSKYVSYREKLLATASLYDIIGPLQYLYPM